MPGRRPPRDPQPGRKRAGLSDRLARQALESLADPFVILDRDWRAIYFNRQAEELALAEPGSVTGRVLWEAFPGLEQSPFGQAYREAMASQTPVRIAGYFPPLDRWYEAHAHPAPDTLTITFRDITEATRRERRASLVQRCALTLGAAADLRSGLVLMLGEMRSALGAEFGELWLSLGERDIIEAVVTEHDDTPSLGIFAAASRGLRMRTDEGLPGVAWTRRETVLVPALDRNPAFRRLDAAQEAGLLAAVMVPVLSGDRPVGVFGLFFIRPLEGSDAASLVAGLPADLGLVVDQKRRDGEIDRIFSLSADPICIASLDGWFLRVNPAWERLLGYTAQELTSRPYLEFVHPEDRGVTGQKTDHLRGGASVWQFENRYRTAEGGWKWLNWSAMSVPDEGVVYGVARDVTERRRREELEALRHAFFSAMATGAPLAEVLAPVAQLAEREVEGARAAVLELDANGRLRTLAAPGLPAEYNAEVDGLLPGPRAGTCGAAVHEGAPVVTSSIETDPRWELYRDIARRHQLAACWSVPLRGRGGAILGTFALYFDRPRTPTMEELGQLERTARLAAIAIERHHGSQELELLHQAVSRLNDMIVITEAAPIDAPGPRIRFVNEAFERLTGWLRDEVVGRDPRFLQGEGTDRAVLDRIRAALEAGRTVREEILNYARDGRPYWVEMDIAPVVDPAGRVTHFVSVERDTTDRHRLEAQVVQAQKMEAVARLAGGVAHDFNNMLTAILGFSDLLLEDAALPPRLAEEVRQIRLAAERAANLTSQLLAFSRRQVLQPATLDVNAVVGGLEGMLRRMLGEDVECRLTLAPGLPSVVTDPNQLEQAIVNLVVNSRDAMPMGGRLTIETGLVELVEADAAQHPEAVPGTHVVIAVSDTGAGMDREVLARAFEPFFTTKPQGRGTGLGLSSVYGIVAQSRGQVRAYSEPGLGTTIRIYLPAESAGDPGPEGNGSRTSTTGTPTGTETILVVEDEELVRHLAVRFLERLGYTVLAAGAGDDALALLADDPRPVHLLLTDVVMPRLPGPQLAQRVVELRPGIRVLFMSGYTEDSIVHHGVLEPGIALLEKPFTYEGLARKVREVLGSGE